MNSTGFRSLVPFLLSLLLAPLLNISTLFAQFHAINTPGTASRPITKNGRVLAIYTSSSATITNPTVTLEVYDSRTGNTTRVSTEARTLFSGWPDMDAEGNVAYVTEQSGRSEVFYYDGKTHTQVSNNSSVKDAPTLTTAKEGVKVGFVRAEGGYVIFRDQEGNIFAYNHASKTVQQVNRSVEENVNVDDEHLSNPRLAMVRQYQFDGKTLFWMHKKTIKDGVEGEITIFKAEAPFTKTPESVATFRAWIPPAKSFLVGQFAGPFLVSCGSEAAWQYYPPSEVVARTPGLPVEFKEGLIGYYDGTSASTIYGPAPLRMQSLRLYSGHLIWATYPEKESNEEFIMQYRFGHVSPLVKNSGPPENGENGKLYWERFGDVEFDGLNVLYTMNEVKCSVVSMSIAGEKKDMRRFTPTGRTGLFTSGSTLPFFTVDQQVGYNGGLEYSNGLAAFISGTISKWNIATYRVHAPASSSAGTAILNHIGQETTLLDWELTEPPIVDRFTVNALSGGCGAGEGASVELKGLTVYLKALSGSLDDIREIQLFQDVDKDGRTSSADKLLFTSNLINPSIEAYWTTPIPISPTDGANFYIRFVLQPGACPCNQYSDSIPASELEFTTVGTVAVGSSVGNLHIPEARFGMFSDEEMFGGDYQTAIAKQRLPKRLGIRIEHFAPKCGTVRFTIMNPPGVDGASIADRRGVQATTLQMALQEDGDDAVASVEMTLGEREGKYLVQAEIEPTQSNPSCPPPTHIFTETAGQLAMEIVDLNDPQFVTASQITRPDGRKGYKVSIADGGPNHDNLGYGGAQRVGMTADGDNLLLVRVRFLGFTSNPGGNVNFSITGLSTIALTTNLTTELPGTFTGTKGTSPIYESNGSYYALSLIRAPNDMSGRDESRVQISATYANGSQSLTATESITVTHPPVLLVHGMWSGPETWKSVFTGPYPGFEIHRVDYSADAAKSFTVSGETLGAKVREVLKNRRDRNRISTSQVSVVAHSMGGLVARQHVADYNGQTYYLPENFGQGNFHKLVTIGTPHWGSPLCALVVKIRDESLVRGVLLDVARKSGVDIESGAIDAMCPGSEDLKELGETPIPTHTVVGWIKDTRIEPFSFKKFGSFLFESAKNLVKIDLATGDPGIVNPSEFFGALFTQFAAEGAAFGYTDLYSADRTDILVTKVSQIGGIATYSEFDKTLHSNSYVTEQEFETGSRRIAQKVFELLRAPVNDPLIFAQKLPAPDIQDPTKTCK